MKISNYLVKPGIKISLSKFSTKDTSGIKSKEEAKEYLERLKKNGRYEKDVY